MAKRAREDAEWWLAASIDDYESAQLLFKGGKYSKRIHGLHNATEKALKAAILAERKRPPYGTGGHNLVRLYEMVQSKLKLPTNLLKTYGDLRDLHFPPTQPAAD